MSRKIKAVGTIFTYVKTDIIMLKYSVMKLKISESIGVLLKTPHLS